MFPFIIISSITLGLIILAFIFVIIIFNIIGFGKRCEGNENLKYLTHKNFDNLNARPIEFKSDKGQLLRGFLYSCAKVSKYKALIVFSHGMGAGHLSYTTEINYLAQKGFLVLAYDNTGTCASEGTKLNGFAQGPVDLKYALKFVASREDLKELPVLLLGHSWGGYSVCNVSALNPDVDIKGIVALSPPDSFNRLIIDQVKMQTKMNMFFLSPIFDILNIIKFGKNGLLKSTETISNNTIPTLIMHGGNDMTVKLENSPVGLKNRIEANPNARAILFDSKYHNVYLAKEGEQYLNDIFAKVGSLPKNSPEAYEVYQSIDYSLITKEDLNVMDSINFFFEECAMKRDFLNE